MHELSIATSIVEIASEEGVRQGGRVEVVHLKLGTLSGVVEHALRFSWDLVCEGSAIEGAKLNIEPADGTELEVTALEIRDG